MLHEESYYRDIGFRCGLEIHQRLATKKKLFCKCDANMPDEQILAKLERRQRAVAGELGNVDISTRFESSKQRSFVYNVYKAGTCLVDIDEEPPHEVNGEALDTALYIAASLNAKIPDEIEPMRKEVVDGSDPSAFQRTMLVGYNGSIAVGEKRVPISSIFLEEESSGINSTGDGYVVYDVNRMGVPLIEIDTDPIISTPKEAKDVALSIGMLLRLGKNVQRGIGSIRQDVNVSIREGGRVEIKGFQDIDTVESVIDNEIERQARLVDIKKELERRKASVGEPVDLTDLLTHTNVKVLKDNTKNGGAVFGVRLTNFAGIVGFEVNPDRRLGSEISDYAKMAGVKGIIHSDEKLDGYGFTEKEIADIKKALGAGQNDAFLLVAGPSDKCKRAAGLAKMRAEIALRGVPLESRSIDSTKMVTRFLRPLPGGSRMYPETDARPIRIEEKRYEELAKGKVDVASKAKELERLIGNKQLAEQMLRSPRLSLFEKAVATTKAKPLVIASVLLEKFTELRRNAVDVDEINDDVVLRIFSLYADARITRAAIEELLKAVPKDNAQVDKLVSQLKLNRISGAELEKLVKGYGSKSKSELMRSIMAEHRLRVDGEELNSMLGSG